jgi:very-short-patch-repair endonuclease
VTDALARRKVSDRQLRRYAEAHRSHPGAARILAVLATEREHGYSRSAAERLLRRLLKPTGLPMPRFNVMVNGALVDCLWQRERLILEVDGYGTHGGRAAFERDRLRDQRHAAAGYVAIRVTWRQLTRRPPAVLTRVAQALALRGARAS